MHRLLLSLPLFALLAAPARAGESLQAQVDHLQQRADALEAQHAQRLDHEVRAYLDHSSAQSAEGASALDGLTVQARFTSVFLATLGADPYDRHAAHGDVDLDFDFEVTENLGLFCHLTANTAGSFPGEFGGIAGQPVLAGSASTLERATLSGLVDGIGVDGTVPTSPGSARVDEVGIRWFMPFGDRMLELELGKLDPRNRYAGNKFADDENTQFLNNLFDDPPAISWPTNAMGPTILGINASMLFGNDDQYRASFGFFNHAGQFFNHGVMFLEFGWTTELQERELNARIYASINTEPDDPAVSFGASADWWATEQIGVFIRVTVQDNQPINDGAPNQIESDWQLGAVFVGLLPDRPDDVLGVAWGYMKGPVRGVIPGGAPENNEMVIELYYRFLLDDGKLQVSPMAQFILDPGAGTFADPDQLVLLGVRVHVSF